MNTAPFLRFGALCVVAAASAAGGVSLSRPEDTHLVAAPTRTPVIKMGALGIPKAAPEVDSALWQAAFAPPPPMVQAANQVSPLNPWRFVGVIGDGKVAKAVFSAPDDPMHTLFLKAGEALPDGRTIARVSDSEVEFVKIAASLEPERTTAAGPSQQRASSESGPVVQAAALTGIPVEILGLFRGVDLSVPAMAGPRNELAAAEAATSQGSAPVALASSIAISGIDLANPTHPGTITPR